MSKSDYNFTVFTDQQVDAVIEKVEDIFLSFDEVEPQGQILCFLADVEQSIIWLAENGYAFDIERWINAEPANFFHDFVGILKHRQPITGELVDCFIPRYAISEGANHG